MKARARKISAQNKNFLLIFGLTALILLILWLIWLFTGALAWGPMDFVFVGVMLLGPGLAYELITRKHKNRLYRIALGIALGTAFIMIWANLAVGLIGSEDEPANWIYIGLLAIGLMGAVIARFKARGMAITMGVMACGQFLIIMIALLVGWPIFHTAQPLIF